MFLIITHNKGDAVNAGQCLGLCLRVATGNDDACPGIDTQRPSNELARLKVRRSCDRAGVNDIGVGKSIKPYQRKICRLQVPDQYRRVTLIDLAAQGGDADFQYFPFAVQWLFIPFLIFDPAFIYEATGPLSRQTKNGFYVENELNSRLTNMGREI